MRSDRDEFHKAALWFRIGEEVNCVESSDELYRVACLPRRTHAPQHTDQLSAVLGTGTLREIQAWALAELCLYRGLFAPITVGAGKTLITYLAPRMVGAHKPLLLVPAKLIDKTRRDFDNLSAEWITTIEPRVCSYELLGRMQSSSYLEDYAPDLIIADEAHRLKNVRAAVTRRVGRYMSAHPDTIFVALSGTMTKRSLRDFAHIMEWCLGDGSPVPLNVYDLEQWCRALDEDNSWFGDRLHPGALKIFGGLNARDGYRRRLVETPGVVASTTSGVDSSLVITKWDHEVPESIEHALAHLDTYWETPDEKPIIEAIEKWRHARELTLGFWYAWDPPPPKKWLDARKTWASFARHVLSRSRSLDSEAQVAVTHADSVEWLNWAAVKDTYTPNTIATWLSRRVIDDAWLWADRHRKGIIWVEHRVVGKALEARGIPFYCNLGKTEQGADIDDADGPICASIAACSEGRNLQRYTHNLVLSPPTTGDKWEQILGRTHREGQKADEVSVEVCLSSRQSQEGFLQALSDARYQKGLLGAHQKLLLADVEMRYGTV